MTWKYRVIERDTPEWADGAFGIHEVYYDDQGRVSAWTEKPVGVAGESVMALVEALEVMAVALGKPVLKESEILKEMAGREGRPGQLRRETGEPPAGPGSDP